MAYSKAYQTVVAGRVREDEMPFFKDNKVATPARVFTLAPTGGKKQPTLEYSYLEDTGVGKKTDQRDPNIAAYNEGSLNLS